MLVLLLLLLPLLLVLLRGLDLFPLPLLLFNFSLYLWFFYDDFLLLFYLLYLGFSLFVGNDLLNKLNDLFIQGIL